MEACGDGWSRQAKPSSSSRSCWTRIRANVDWSSSTKSEISWREKKNVLYLRIDLQSKPSPLPWRSSRIRLCSIWRRSQLPNPSASIPPKQSQNHLLSSYSSSLKNCRSVLASRWTNYGHSSSVRKMNRLITTLPQSIFLISPAFSRHSLPTETHSHKAS